MTPKENPVPISGPSYPLLPQPQMTTNLLSSSIDLPTLAISYKWSCAVWGCFLLSPSVTFSGSLQRLSNFIPSHG